MRALSADSSLWTMACVALALAGCARKIDAADCNALVDHYATLVVQEHNPGATAELIAAERDRERRQARGDDGFRNCTTEITRPELDCALKAGSPDGVLKCLE